MRTIPLACVLILTACGDDDSLAHASIDEVPGGIRGRLCNRDTGTWVSNAVVKIGDDIDCTITDDDGAFELSGLPPGEHRLQASDGEGFFSDRTVVVRSGDVTDVGVERCDIYRGGIVGRVCTLMAPTGVAHADVMVEAGDETSSTQTNAHGEFTLESVPIGRHRVRVVGVGVDEEITVDVEPFTITEVETRCGVEVIDRFVQPAAPTGRADILFVVDNSSSMCDDQERLATSFDTFFTWLHSSNVNYQLAVTTTDVSELGERGSFVGPLVTPETPDALGTFTKIVEVGCVGSEDEQGLAAAALALQSAAAEGHFLRDDARLYLVFVSDEDDASPEEVERYHHLFVDIAGDLFITAIAGPVPPESCSGTGWYAQAAYRYAEIADLFDAICQENFGFALQNLALEVVATAGEFALSEAPATESLVVTTSGETQPERRWQYLPETNSLRFVEPWLPAAGAEVVATYVSWL